MKYFIDTEFIEGFKKPLFGKRRHFIDLISIAIIAEDGRSYYAISNEYRYKDADDWVKTNVIVPLYIETVHGDRRNYVDVDDFQYHYGKSNKQIAEEIAHFCNPELFLHNVAEPHLEFYGYYADYDWVLFCSLFGRMIDLPKVFPMYCRDLKQMLDEKTEWFLKHGYGTNKVYPESLEQSIEWLKNHKTYPKQENEHNALDDAKWNKDLYNFLKQL
jgi:3' exoribonuclease, RNase T-like